MTLHAIPKGISVPEYDGSDRLPWATNSLDLIFDCSCLIRVIPILNAAMIYDCSSLASKFLFQISCLPARVFSLYWKATIIDWN